MAKTHDLGRLYLTSVRYLHPAATPRIGERGWSHEIEEPYREGHCLVLRVPFTLRGIAVGLWGRPSDETDRLLAAVGCRDLGPLDLEDDGLA